MKDEMKRYYDSDRAYPNTLSVWFSKIKDVPGIRIPQTITIPVPLEVFAAFECDEAGGGMDAIKSFLQRDVAPRMSNWRGGKCFMKNGCFSNKFDFRHSITNPRKLLDDFIEIQYASVCNETGGVSEINLREVIPWDNRKTATIYSDFY